MNYLRVKKWEEFQHYKDRAPPWIKFHVAVLNDYSFTKLPDELKAHLMLIWLLASQTDGKVPNDAKFIRDRIGANKSVNLTMLIEHGWLIPEPAAGRGESPTEAQQDGVREKWPSRYVSAQLRDRVMERDGSKCTACGCADDLEIDHIVPVSKGGEGVFDNLQVLCRPCNRRKRVKSAEQLATQTSGVCVALARSRETEAYKATETEAEQTSAQERLADPEHPPWLPVAAWSDWVAYRKARKGWTAKAASLCIRELGRLRAQGHDPTEVIERSIQNAWTGLFPPRERGRSKADKTAATAEAMYGDLVREIRGQQPPDDSIPGESKRVA